MSSQKGGVKTCEFYGANSSRLVEYTPSAANALFEYIYLGGKRIAQIEPSPTTVTMLIAPEQLMLILNRLLPDRPALQCFAIPVCKRSGQ